MMNGSQATRDRHLTHDETIRLAAQSPPAGYRQPAKKRTGGARPPNGQRVSGERRAEGDERVRCMRVLGRRAVMDLPGLGSEPRPRLARFEEETLLAICAEPKHRCHQ